MSKRAFVGWPRVASMLASTLLWRARMCPALSLPYPCFAAAPRVHNCAPPVQFCAHRSPVHTRLDRKVEIPLPNEQARIEILKIHAAKITKREGEGHEIGACPVPGARWPKVTRSLNRRNLPVLQLWVLVRGCCRVVE